MASLSNYSANSQYIVKAFSALFGAGVTGDLIASGDTLLTAGTSKTTLVNVLLNNSVVLNAFPLYGANITNDAFAGALLDNMTKGSGVDATTLAGWKTAVAAALPSYASRAAAVTALIDAVTSYTGSDANLAKVTAVVNNRAEVGAYAAQNGATTFSTLSGLQAQVANVDTTAASVTTAQTGSAQTGTTFTLTSGTDTVTGTAGNDTIVGDFASTLNAADQVNGGAGTDTLKMYSSFDSTKMPVSVTNVEVLDLVTAADAAIDLTSWAKSSTGIEKFIVENAAAISGRTITTTAGQSLSLATGAANTNTAGAVTWAASATDTTANLTLNGYQGGTGVTAAALTITGAATATQNIASTGAANAVSTLTLAATTTKLVVTGDKALTVGTNLISGASATALKTVDASANTGGVAITLAATENAAFAFTGGSGNDSVKFADDGLGALTSGAQLDGGAGTADKIGLLDTALSNAEYTAINAAKNFEVLGLNAALTVDASLLTSIKTFSLDTNAAQVINSVATGSTVNVTAAHAANVTVTSAVGVTDLAVNVGTATTAGIAAAGVMSITGPTSIAMTSNGTNAAANTITTLTLTDNAVVKLTGANDLTIGTITNATTTAHKIDASGLTGKLVMTNGSTATYAAGSALGDVIIGGSAADTLVAGTNSTKLTGNGGADTFSVAGAVAGGTANANITTITDFTKGDKIVFTAATAFTAAKVDLTGAATEQAAIDLLVAGNAADLKWGVYNGNTYLVDDVAAGASMAATDVIVKLTGTLDLSTSTLAANTLTFA